MKLLKCHIENFGKLSNFDYVFKSGLNTIKEENGFGKTTFASFIKSMFYGMDSKRNTKQLIDRKKYEPWQGGAFGGNIEFQLNNKKYKLERFFGKKENEDIFKLYNLETNLECTDFSQNIGEEIFKLNKEAYERSTFISGQNVETSINDSISAKLGNVLESENDVNTSKKAFEILDEAIKTYKKTGGRGELNEKMLRKTMIEKDLEKSKIDEISYLQRKKQNYEINKKIKEKELEKETLQKKIKLQIEEDTKKAKMEYYNNINNNYEQSKRLYEEYENKLQEKSEIESKIELNANNLKNIASIIENFESSIKANKNINIVLGIIAIVFAFIATISIVRNSNKILVALYLVTLVCIVALIYKANMSKNKKRNILLKRKEKENLENLLDTLNNLHEKEKQTQRQEFERLKTDYEQKLKIKQEFEKENNVQELRTTYSFEENSATLERKINFIEEEINKLNDQKNYNKSQIELLETNLDEAQDKEIELEEIKQEIAKMQEQYEILVKTKQYLEKAKEQFSSRYLEDMQKSFVENVKLINGVEIKSSLDVNLEVKINEQGSNKELKYFSTGYQDLIYLCMRFSLIQALFKNEEPFIILDDPFVNLDEKKIKNAINLINILSEKYQIIYFVCHESRKI